MEPRGPGVEFYWEQQTAEQRTTVATGLATPLIAGCVAGLLVVVVAAVILVVLLRPLLAQRQDDGPEPTADREERPEAQPADPGEPSPRAPGSDPVAAVRALSAPDLVLLTPQPLRVGDEAEIRVTSAPLVRVEFRTGAGPWIRLDGDVLRVTATGDPLRVEARAGGDVGATSPVVIWSWPVRPANRPPNLAVAHQPDAPRVGEVLPVSLAASDPDGDRVAIEYRVGDDGPWQPAPLGQLVLSDLPVGPYAVSFRAVDEFGMSSPVAARRWDVLPRRNRSPELLLAAPLPRELWVGDHLHLETYATDPDGDPVWVEVSPDRESWRETFEPQLTMGPLEAGVVNVHLRAVDKSGAASEVVSHSVLVRRRPVRVAELGGRSYAPPVVSSAWREPPFGEAEPTRHRPTPQEQLFKRWRSGSVKTQWLNREESALRIGSRRF